MKRMLFAAVLVLIVLASIEFLLHAAAFASLRVDYLLSPPNVIAFRDPQLESRPHPGAPGHDARGFRNPSALATADLISLGDSHTYGDGVEPHQAWPRKLEDLRGIKVYSMAFGGYGPVHGLLLFDQAAELKPKTIVYGFYAGNDYFDSFNMVYNRGQFPELVTQDEELQKEIRAAEERYSISEQVLTLNRERSEPPNVSGMRLLLSKYSKTYGLLRRLTFQFSLLSDSDENTVDAASLRDRNWGRAKDAVKDQPEDCLIFETEKFRTIFRSEYRGTAVNLEDKRIAEGLQISLRAIRKMSESARSRNIEFAVLLIPSKESVFAKEVSTPVANYLSLIENEEKSREIAKKYFGENGITYLEALPALRDRLAGGSQPYFESSDGHPNEMGHETIARVVADFLEERQSREVK